MMIIGVDYHPSFQQMAFLVTVHLDFKFSSFRLRDYTSK
jgi:hypothetical protein